eukprot:6189427-Pleurochrysis_carterae.AAC.1
MKEITEYLTIAAQGRARSDTAVKTAYLPRPRTPGLACTGYSESLRDPLQSDRPSRAGNTHYIIIQQMQSRSGRGRGGWARLRARLRYYSS